MIKNILIAGVDDATKCPCIGSIFVAGVIADETIINMWKECGVKDSKLLTPKKREALALMIKKTALGFAIHEITPVMIDDKILNLNAWEMVVFLKIVDDLRYFGIPQDVYVDNWETSEKGFRSRFKNLLSNSLFDELLEKHKVNFSREQVAHLNFIPEHQADEKYTVVGAASILAKTSSDAQYRKYREIYGDFGSGSPADPKTRLFVWQHRDDNLPIVRTSWNTFKTLSLLDRIEDDWIYARQAKKNKLTI